MEIFWLNTHNPERLWAIVNYTQNLLDLLISLFPHWLNAKFPGFWLDEINLQINKGCIDQDIHCKRVLSWERFQVNDKIGYLE